MCFHEKFYRQFIAHVAEPRDNTFADRGNDGVPSEFFPSVDIRDVDFDDGSLQRRNRIADGVGIMRVGPGIDDDSIKRPVHRLLHLVNQGTFVVRLKELKLHVRKSLRESVFNVGEGRRPVDCWLAFPQKVQIRTVNDEDFHSYSIVLGLQPKTKLVKGSILTQRRKVAKNTNLLFLFAAWAPAFWDPAYGWDPGAGLAVTFL
jgi:hypothetical protein